MSYKKAEGKAMSVQLIYPECVHHNDTTFQADVTHVENIGDTEHGACKHGEKYYQVARRIVEGAEWEVVREMDARDVSEHIGGLCKEFKTLQHSIRGQRLPLRRDASVFTRVDAILRECAAYGVDIQRY